MENEELREELDLLIDEIPEEEAIRMHNSLADYNDVYDKIYYMDDFDEVLTEQNYSPKEVLMYSEGTVDLNDEYFTIRDTLEILSFTDLYSANSPWDKEGLIEYIIETEDNLGIQEIEDLFKRFGIE